MENYLLDIEAYLDGSMTDVERRAFEEKLQTNAQLKEELKEFQVLRTDLAYHFATKDVEEALKWRGVNETKKRVRTWMFICLLVATLASLFFVWNNLQQTKTSEAPENQSGDIPSSQAPVKSENENLKKDTDNDPEKVQLPPTAPQKSRPIAGDLKRANETTSDLYRDLPKEPVSEAYRQFFETSMQSFAVAVRPQGIWTQAVQELDNHRPAKAYQILKSLPPADIKKDTTLYLQAVSVLQMHRPAAAEDLLYPLITEKKWQTEGHYLLIWVYLLQGNTDLAKSSLKLLPDAYRDKKAIANFLDK